MKTRINLVFRLRQSKSLPNGAARIYLRITVGEDRVELSTKRHVLPAKWNIGMQKVSGSGEEAKSTLENKEVTAAAIKGKLLGQDTDWRYIIEEFKEHNRRMEALIGKQYCRGTWIRFETTLSHTQEFIQWKYKTADLEVSRLTYDFIESFAFWFKSVRNFGHNTTMKYLANFKKVILYCVRNGWLAKNPFAGFKLSLHPVKIIVLTDHDLKNITEKHFLTERMEKVRDIFLFSCY